jgi:hypothetical protein
MKYMRYLMALAILSAMMGWAYATETEMPGGAVSYSTSGAGSVGHAYSFYDDASSLSADIFASATTNGIGTAYVNVNVPTEASKTVTGIGTVTAKGTVEAQVDGSTGAKVTSVGWIHSGVYKDSNGVYGNASIYSGIGRTFSNVSGLTGIPAGKFEASANADGRATYNIVDVDKKKTREAKITGVAEGSTTIEGAVDGTGGLIGGSLVGNTYNLKGPAYSIISTTSGNYVDKNGEKYNSSTSLNEIKVAARNDPCMGDGKAYVAGTADGSASSSAMNTSEICNSKTGDCDWKTYGASSSKDDSMSADVRVLKEGDAAEANAKVYVTASYYPALNESYASSDVLTHAKVKRITANDDKTDAGMRAYGEAFVSEGSWQAMATNSTAHREGASGIITEDLSSNAAVSGSFGKNTEPLANGIGSGTFLLNSKNLPAWADMSLKQTAGPTGTKMDVKVDIMGPRAASLGSWTWDGSGVYGYFDDLHVERTTPTSKILSTDIADVNSYLWVDGTNDEMFNGPGFDSVTATFNPSGSFTGVTWDFTPSPTQRQTTVTMGTSQS